LIKPCQNVVGVWFILAHSVAQSYLYTVLSPVVQVRQQASYEHQLLLPETEYHLLLLFQHCLVLQPEEKAHTPTIVIELKLSYEHNR